MAHRRRRPLTPIRPMSTIPNDADVAPVATDKELDQLWWDAPDGLEYRFIYELGRAHGTQAPLCSARVAAWVRGLTDEQLLEAWELPEYEPLSRGDTIMQLREVFARLTDD